ncbi:RNaseH domain-containing protein [Streptomyces sp. NBC_01306]|uniref:RNaseH domain-containing protein n=1 Tax=Streptomyces sp. NBC_01306 TaxID=2903819 RepID=UPI00338F969F
MSVGGSSGCGGGSPGATPERPAVIAAAVHQLRFHDEYHPLARPLPLHLAKLAEEYFLPLAPAAATEQVDE